MNVLRKKFVVIFVAIAFAFIAITNLLVRPVNGDWFPRTDSPIALKHTLAAVTNPVKMVLFGPLPKILDDPDPAPPVRVIASAAYLSLLALVLHFILSKVFPGKKT